MKFRKKQALFAFVAVMCVCTGIQGMDEPKAKNEPFPGYIPEVDTNIPEKPFENQVIEEWVEMKPKKEDLLLEESQDVVMQLNQALDYFKKLSSPTHKIITPSELSQLKSYIRTSLEKQGDWVKESELYPYDQELTKMRKTLAKLAFEVRSLNVGALNQKLKK